MRRRVSMAVSALLAVAVVTGCGPRGGKKERTLQSVAYETVTRSTVTRTVGLIGSVQGENQATAVSKLMGRVTSVVKPEGSWVNQDDPIAYVVNDIPGMDYQPGPVRAPIAGYVGKVYVDIGQTIAQGMPVASVANYGSRVKVKATISDQDLRFVRVGAKAEVSVTAFPDTVFAGTVTKVAPMLDQVSRTATVELVVDNSGRKLIPGMACGVQLVLEQRKDVLALPLAALFTNGFTKIAALDGNTARFREIQTGLVGDRSAEILSGVNEGDKVITTGKERVEDGNEVRPVEGGR